MSKFRIGWKWWLAAAGVVTGCGVPRISPERSLTGTRQRFMLPPRLLAK